MAQAPPVAGQPGDPPGKQPTSTGPNELVADPSSLDRGIRGYIFLGFVANNANASSFDYTLDVGNATAGYIEFYSDTINATSGYFTPNEVWVYVKKGDNVRITFATTPSDLDIIPQIQVFT